MLTMGHKSLRVLLDQLKASLSSISVMWVFWENMNGNFFQKKNLIQI